MSGETAACPRCPLDNGVLSQPTLLCVRRRGTLAPSPPALLRGGGGLGWHRARHHCPRDERHSARRLALLQGASRPASFGTGLSVLISPLLVRISPALSSFARCNPHRPCHVRPAPPAPSPQSAAAQWVTQARRLPGHHGAAAGRVPLPQGVPCKRKNPAFSWWKQENGL